MPTDLYSRVKNRWQTLWEKQTKETHEFYGEDFINRILGTSEEVLSKLSGNPKHVINAYLHAALSTRPQLRYLVGLDANILVLLLELMPTYIGDIFANVLLKDVLPAGKSA